MSSFASRFAVRLNSFAARPDLFWPAGHGKPGTLDLLQRAAQVRGLTHIDLNYPDHVQGVPLTDLKAFFGDSALVFNGCEMRFYSDPAFSLGAFTHPEAAVRSKAIDLCRRAVDLVAEIGGEALNIWPGQDGFDYTFQMDYDQAWAWEIEGIRQVAAHNPDIIVSIEYKPNEPRAFSLLPNIGTTLLAVREAGQPNLGLVLDFCHQLIAGEQPAFAVALTQRYSQLVGIHLNDGYRSRDDGLMVASVHPLQTLELLDALMRIQYQRVIYFDTFPRSEDPVKECETNIQTVHLLTALLETMPLDDLRAGLQQQDAVANHRLLMHTLLRAEQRM